MKGMIFGMGMSIHDKFNGTNKLGELKEKEGTEFSYVGSKFKILEVGDVDSKVERLSNGNVENFNSQILWNVLFF